MTTNSTTTEAARSPAAEKYRRITSRTEAHQIMFSPLAWYVLGMYRDAKGWSWHRALCHLILTHPATQGLSLARGRKSGQSQA